MNFLFLFASLIGNAAFVLTRSRAEQGSHFQGDIKSVSPALFYSKSGLINEYYRWPNGIIPYTFESNYPKEFKEMFLKATEHISDHTCITFVPRTNQKDYIKVKSGSGCYADAGRIGGEQEVSLPEDCLDFGTHVHELIHSIGFFHEQSRPDRDDYVKIHKENMKKRDEFNFEKYPASYVTSFGLKYDYDSIMHYEATAFSKNGKPTITTIPEGIPIGQDDGMSDTDILRINKMYKCD